MLKIAICDDEKVFRDNNLEVPKTAAEIAAFLKLSISMPIGILEIIKKLIVVTNQVIRRPSITTAPMSIDFRLLD